jgi:molybdopterin converting factor subunit 1
MKVRLLFFAAVRERMRTTETVRELAGPTTVEALWQQLQREHPSLGDIRVAIAFALNREYVDSKTMVHDNDEVAFIPPVSGGSA